MAEDAEKKDDPIEEAGEEAREFLPPLEFGSIVFPFYSQALIKLGLIEDPLGGGGGTNVDYAKRLIDILDLLKERTAGLLEPKEADFLESCLIQLKMHYMQKAKILKV
jgi:hypothetical protein